MKTTSISLCTIVGIILAAIAIGRSKSVQDSLSLADGYEVLVEHPK